MGTANPRFFGPEYLMDTEKLIVITLQYRLGVFGFLSSGDRSAKGNFGLKDQNMALKWINRNIKSFGGNREAVTLFGDSCGGASTHFQMMSEKSNDLFQKAIISGGNAFSFWALERNPAKLFRQFASIAGVPNANTADTSIILKALSALPAKSLVEFSEQMFTNHPVNPIFKPVIEGNWKSAIVAEDPFDTWKSGNYQQRPFLMSMTPNEAGISSDFVEDKKMREEILNDFDNSLMATGGLCRSEVGPIKKYYFGDNPSEKNMFNYTVVSIRM